MGDPGLDYNLLCDAIYPGDFDKYVDKLLVVLEDMNEESPHAAYESGAYRSNARSTGKARPASAGAMRTTKSSLNRSAWGGASPTMVTTTAKDDTMMATGSTKPSVNAHAPTMRSYLREMNDQIHNCGGDEIQMLQRVQPQPIPTPRGGEAGPDPRQHLHLVLFRDISTWRHLGLGLSG